MKNDAVCEMNSNVFTSYGVDANERLTVILKSQTQKTFIMDKSYNGLRQIDNSIEATKWIDQHHASLLSYTIGYMKRFELNSCCPDEIVSEIFIKLSTTSRDLKTINAPFPFMLKMMKHLIIDAKKKVKRDNTVLVCEEPFLDLNNDKYEHNEGYSTLVLQDNQEILRKVLSENEFIILDMLGKGYSYEDASGMLDENINTLRTWVYRGRMKLEKVYRGTVLL